MLKQFRPGLTFRLEFSFFDDTGINRTGVNSPIVDIFNPFRSKLIDAGALVPAVSGLTGQFTFDFFVEPGLTQGHYFAIGTGLTQTDVTIFADQVPFEVIDPISEPFWVSLAELREHLELDTEDHSRDSFLRGILQASMEAVEQYARRQFGIRAFSELIEVKSTDRVLLKNFPIQSITALTATAQIVPRDVDQLFVETITDSNINFFFTLDAENGVMKLTDFAGFDEPYDGVLLGVTYVAGFPHIPESIRRATLMLASKMCNLSSSEGMDSVRLSDISFTLSKRMFSKEITDLIDPFRNTGL